MAHVLRLIVGLVLLWVGVAQAAVPMVSSWRANSSGDMTFDNPVSAGAYDLAWTGYRWPPREGTLFSSCAVESTGTSSVGTPSAEVRCYNPPGNASWVGGAYVIPGSQSCPANSTLVGGQCVCSTGYVEGTGADVGKCVVKPPAACPEAGLGSSEVTWETTDSSATYNFCENGPGSCGMYARPSVCVKGSNGTFGCVGDSYFTGSRPASCSGAGSTPADPAPNKPPAPPCPAGQQQGSVNGVTICAPIGTDKPTDAPAPGNGSSEVKKPDGSAVQTSQSGTTSCSGGTCTTTTTNNTTIINKPGDTSCPSGTTQGTTTKDGQTVTTCSSSSTSTSSQSQTGYCKGSGAGSAQCGGDGSGSSFGGNCAAGFKAVSEDAVLNAMAEEQWRRNCQFFDKKPDDTEESLSYDEMKAKGKSGVDQTASNPGNRTVNFGPGDFDSTSPIGNGACITDKQFSLWGASFTAPFSIICPYIEYIRLLLLASGFILAARIVIAGG